MNNDERVFALLVLQNALLGAVGSAIRSVSARFDGREFMVNVVHDGPIAQADKDAFDEVHTLILSHVDPSTVVTVKLIRVDSPNSFREWVLPFNAFSRLE